MNDKIFLQISGWRDPFIVNTVRSAYDNAMFPEDITFGCVFQGYSDDAWMIDGIEEISSNVKLTYLDAMETPLSVTKIRGTIGTSTMTDESYYMQVDSHTQFRKNWDVDLKAELKIANDHFGKSIITNQVSNFNNWDSPFLDVTTTSIPDYDRFKSIDAPVVGKVVLKNGLYQTNESFSCANCIFAYSDYIREIPQPENVVFQYEQPMITLRTFTGGYNLISSARVYVAGFDYSMSRPGSSEFVRHLRRKDPNWEHRWNAAEAASKGEYERVLTNRIVDHKNGLLEERTLDDFIEFAGYNPLTLEVLVDVSDYHSGKTLELTESDLAIARSNIVNQRLSN